MLFKHYQPRVTKRGLEFLHIVLLENTCLVKIPHLELKG